MSNLNTSCARDIEHIWCNSNVLYVYELFRNVFTWLFFLILLSIRMGNLKLKQQLYFKYWKRLIRKLQFF